VWASRTVEFGFSHQLDNMSLSARAAAWIEPRFLLGWVCVAARGMFQEWVYWETYCGIPIRSDTGPSIGITVGVELKIF